MLQNYADVNGQLSSNMLTGVACWNYANVENEDKQTELFIATTKKLETA